MVVSFSLKQGIVLFLKKWVFSVPKMEGLAVPKTIIIQSLSLLKHSLDWISVLAKLHNFVLKLSALGRQQMDNSNSIRLQEAFKQINKVLHHKDF